MAGGDALARWMRQQLGLTGARGFVVGRSGGLDSAVVARLGQLAAPGATLGVVMPCHSDPQDEQDAAFVASHLLLSTVRADLSAGYDALVAEAQGALRAVAREMREMPRLDGSRGRVPLANIKPRLR